MLKDFYTCPNLYAYSWPYIVLLIQCSVEQNICWNKINGNFSDTNVNITKTLKKIFFFLSKIKTREKVKLTEDK